MIILITVNSRYTGKSKAAGMWNELRKHNVKVDKLREENERITVKNEDIKKKNMCTS